MSWQNQFSLSLELTRALGPASINHAADSIVEFARGLQRTGSDFIIEEDLAAIFARFHIQPQFLEEFKQITVADAKVSKISDFIPIALQAGPGPTVQRALRDPAFMPMIVHLSMFAATHELEPFSDALSEILVKRNGKGNEVPTAFYSPKDIKGATQVCAEQTAGYKWHYMIDTVFRLLGLPAFIPTERRGDNVEHPNRFPVNDVDRFYSLSWDQLNASFDMLLAVQRLYTDHIMVSDGRVMLLSMLIPNLGYRGLKGCRHDGTLGSLYPGFDASCQRLSNWR